MENKFALLFEVTVTSSHEIYIIVKEIIFTVLSNSFYEVTVKLSLNIFILYLKFFV